MILCIFIYRFFEIYGSATYKMSKVTTTQDEVVCDLELVPKATGDRKTSSTDKLVLENEELKAVNEEQAHRITQLT
jgi:hypothetical protein